MDLNDVMDQIAERLRVVPGLLAVYDSPTDQVTAPAAVVSVPDDITYDANYARGMDRMTLPVILVVAKPAKRAARVALAPYTDGAGDSSIKATLESGTYTAFDDIRVARAESDVVTIGTADYLAVVFTCEIVGSGSS